MLIHRSACKAESRGFTLVELMVTLTIVAVILAAAYATLFSSQGSIQRLTAVVDVRGDARATVQLLERELRMAGSGWGRLPVNGSYLGVPFVLNPVNPGYGGLAANDSVVIAGAWSGASTTLREAMPTPSAILKCVSTEGFALNDLAVVTNGSTAHLFQVTQVASPPGNLQHNPSSPFNDPGGLSAWPPGGYGTGSQVYKLDWVTYRFDSTLFRAPAVVRYQVGELPQLLAPHVRGFKVWYQLDDGTQTRDPEDLSRLDRIRPVVQIAYRDANRVTVADSVWAVARPRTF